jgi:hypothetical protein
LVEDTEKLAFLFLGWLLGLLGPIISDAIRRRRENALGREALLSELREVGCMLAVAAYGVRMSQGTTSREFLEWLRKDLEVHAASEQFQAFVPRLSAQLSWSPDDFTKATAYGKSPEGTGSVLQRYSVPLLDSRVSALWTFDTSFQRDLLSVRQDLYLLDDLVAQSRKYMDMTFSNLENGNDKLVKDNFTQACALYAERAQRTIDRIRRLLYDARYETTRRQP